MAPLVFDFILFLGIIFAFICGLLFSIGIILQKKGVMNMPEIKLNEIKSMTAMLKSKEWRLGLIISLLGAIPYVITQSLIGVTLTQPLTVGLQLAFTVIFAIKILDEKMGKLEIIGFLILLTSPVFLVLGSVTPPDAQIGSSDFFLRLTLFFIPCLILLAFFFILIKIKSDNEFIGGVSYALISGVFFAMGANLLQTGIEILKNQVFEFLALGIVFMLFCFAGNAAATVIQQLSFQKGKVGIAVSLQASTNLFLAVFGGILVFSQQILNPVFFIIGILMILIGNILLVQFQTRLEEIEYDRPSLD